MKYVAKKVSGGRLRREYGQQLWEMEQMTGSDITVSTLKSLGTGKTMRRATTKEVITMVMMRHDERLNEGSTGGMRRVRGRERGC